MSKTKQDVSFIFDMDGVLLDTERIAMKSWKGAFSDFGVDAREEILRSTIGIGLIGTIEICKVHFGEQPYEKIARRRFEIGDEIMSTSGIPVKPGIPQLLHAVRNVALSVAVATSTPFQMAKDRLTKAGLFGEFDVVIGGDMIARGKPAPDIYLKATSGLEMDPSHCLAIEDSGPGIQSAAEAGLSVVFIEDLTIPDAAILSLCIGKYSDATAFMGDLAHVLETL